MSWTPTRIMMAFDPANPAVGWVLLASGQVMEIELDDFKRPPKEQELL